jgi:hypothetical protein
MGRNLLPETLAIILRFRLCPVAIIGDVSQAFLQLVLDQKDRDLTRFFWYRIFHGENGYTITNDVTTYRFTRLPFGLTCSPFLLSGTLRELSANHKEEFPKATALVDNSMYVDDVTAGAETDNEVIALYYELTSLMKQIQLAMAKWATNSPQLKAIWKAEGQEINREVQVLGVDWSTDTDFFSVDHQVVTDKLSKGPTTKTNLLQATADLSDPLGLVSPVSIIGKILFQDTWRRGISWDEILPHGLGVQCHTWVSTLPSLSCIRVPRHVNHSLKETSHLQSSAMPLSERTEHPCTADFTLRTVLQFN